MDTTAQQRPPTTRTSPVVTDESLLARCKSFTELQLWPRSTRIDARGWLENFNDDQKKFAVHLLNGFMYFSSELVSRLFVAAFQNLSQHVVTSKKYFLTARDEWRHFFGETLFVRVTGESPSDADSGYIFSRAARDKLGVDESRILSPETALESLIAGKDDSVVFVDDFVGSGQQFATLWHRPYTLTKPNTTTSFQHLSLSLRSARFFYCPLIATAAGCSLIRSECPSVLVKPAHLLPPEYSALHPNSILWPDHLRPEAPEFLRTVSLSVGIPDSNGGVNDWRGFHAQGLAIAFEHGMPDASLPLFTWNSNGWRPLLRYK